MPRPDKMTHEVCCHFAEKGSITFQVAANFYGEGDVDDGILEMLTSMYPEAIYIDATLLSDLVE